MSGLHPKLPPWLAGCVSQQPGLPMSGGGLFLFVVWKACWEGRGWWFRADGRLAEIPVCGASFINQRHLYVLLGVWTLLTRVNSVQLQTQPLRRVPSGLLGVPVRTAGLPYSVGRRNAQSIPSFGDNWVSDPLG